MPQIHGEKLRQRVAELGLSDSQLANAAGCGTGHLRNVLAGYRTPSPSLTHKLARAVAMPVDDLLAEPLDASPLRQRRQAAGISPFDLAGRVGISYSHFNNIERGRMAPSLRVLRELAAILGCSIADIDPHQANGTAA